MVIPLIKCYHCILAHPGWKQSRMTIQARYYHPDIQKQVNNFHCEYCQRMKILRKGMGLLPERDLTNTPWYVVAVDLIGLWTAKTEPFNGKFYALMCIDTKPSDAIARKFENTWLAQYPRPARVVHDNDGKFAGYAFASLLRALGIKDVPKTNI